MGLRWWSNVKEDGTTEWVFESLEDMSEINSADYKLFWIGLYGTPVLWLGLLITGIMMFKFQWLVIVVIALLLSGANIYGYTKCNADAKNRASQQEGARERERERKNLILVPFYSSTFVLFLARLVCSCPRVDGALAGCGLFPASWEHFCHVCYGSVFGTVLQCHARERESSRRGAPLSRAAESAGKRKGNMNASARFFSRFPPVARSRVLCSCS